MKIAVVAITRHGIALAGKRRRRPARRPALRAGKVPRRSRERRRRLPRTAMSGKVGDQVPALFAAFDGIVAIVSLGAVVRLIAPHLQGKESDPAVVVVDEAGKFAIPVLSGHLGGANALAGHLATALGATPVLTTASDARATIAVDLLGRELGWTFEATHDELVHCSAAMVNDEPVALVQEAGSTDWWTIMPTAAAAAAGQRALASPGSRTSPPTTSPPCSGSAAAPCPPTRRAPGRPLRHLPSAGRMTGAVPAPIAGARPRLRPRHTGQHHRAGHRRSARRLRRPRSADVRAVASIDLKADEPGWPKWRARTAGPSASTRRPNWPPSTCPIPRKPCAGTPARRRSRRPRRCSPPAPTRPTCSSKNTSCAAPTGATPPSPSQDPP
jgi:cobalt-precorrin 5A hydrolase